MENQILSTRGDELVIPAYHPGELLLEEIEYRKMVKKEVANALEILPNHLSEIFTGKRNISPTMAVKLEELLDISAEYWHGLQSFFDIQQARIARKNG